MSVIRLLVLLVVVHGHWSVCTRTAPKILPSSTERQQEGQAPQSCILHPQRRRKTPSTGRSTELAQPGHCAAGASLESNRGRSGSHYMDSRQQAQEDGRSSTHHVEASQASAGAPSYGWAWPHGTRTHSSGKCGCHEQRKPRSRRPNEKTSAVQGIATIPQYFRRVSDSGGGDAVPQRHQRKAHDGVRAKLQASVKAKDGGGQTVGMERDLRVWFGGQQAARLHAHVRSATACSISDGECAKRCSTRRSQSQEGCGDGGTLGQRRCANRGRRGTRGGRARRRPVQADADEGEQAGKKVRALRYQRARHRQKTEKLTPSSQQSLHLTFDAETACAVASPHCHEAELSVSALPDARMEPSSRGENGSQVIPPRTRTALRGVRKQSIRRAAYAAAGGQAVNLRGRQVSENNWHEIFPGISLPHKGGTPSFHQEGRAVQKRPGQARRHLETLVSFNVLSAKEDSCSNKSAGRWFLLESVFFENKVDVAMLQGTMEIGTSKTVGEHYVIYKHGASKWRPGYAAGVAVMVRKHRHAGDVTVHNISERLMFLEIKSSNRHDVYGSGYAPGEWDSEEVRTKFYDLLQTTMEALPKRATKHLGIDNNGTVCRCEPCSGKWAQAPDGQPSANGQALLDICEAMTLRIANTHFHDPHPSTCYTYGNGQEQSRQIDFIAIAAGTPKRYAAPGLNHNGHYISAPMDDRITYQFLSK